MQEDQIGPYRSWVGWTVFQGWSVTHALKGTLGICQGTEKARRTPQGVHVKLVGRLEEAKEKDQVLELIDFMLDKVKAEVVDINFMRQRWPTLRRLTPLRTRR